MNTNIVPHDQVSFSIHTVWTLCEHIIRKILYFSCQENGLSLKLTGSVYLMLRAKRIMDLWSSQMVWMCHPLSLKLWFV